ncbi:MAG TPA: hypothetical protein VI488_15795, partial [Candidatus Angelobacter sp.]
AHPLVNHSRLSQRGRDKPYLRIGIAKSASLLYWSECRYFHETERIAETRQFEAPFVAILFVVIPNPYHPYRE